jgi:glutamine cyclotransferase
VIHILVIALLLLVESTVANNSDYEVIDSLEHNPAYFTQGLEFYNGLMFESSGRYGKSRIRAFRPDNDETLVEKRIADKYFAEGLTIFNGEVFLLTWKENTLFVLDPTTLKTKRTLTYAGEGWGLASTGNQLVMSDGSETIYFRNASTFRVDRTVRVKLGQRYVTRINELEFAQGFLWANVWHTPLIIKINPTNGSVVQYYDLSALVAEHTNGGDEKVLNGIAYDAEKDGFWVTGKLWSKRYLVRFE